MPLAHNISAVLHTPLVHNISSVLHTPLAHSIPSVLHMLLAHSMVQERSMFQVPVVQHNRMSLVLWLQD
jgi:hypothetical protein